MPKLSVKQLLLAAIVLMLFAPVYLCIGSPALRPTWLMAHVAAVPVSVLVVVILMVVFVGFTWAFSGRAFSTGQDGDEQR